MYKLQQTKTGKAVFALAMMIMIASILVGCTNGYIDDVYEQSADFEQNYDFLNEKPAYEFDDEELNRKIDSIKEISYETNNEFDENNIPNLSKEEIDSIAEYDFSLADSESKVDYPWYSNGEVDSELLSDVIIENTKAEGIAVTDDTLRSISALACNFEAYLNTLRSLNINFNEADVFNKINNICFNVTDDQNVYASYGGGNEISINYETTRNEDDDYFALKVLHEFGHAMLNSNTKTEEIKRIGISIQNGITGYNADDFAFIEEFTVDDLASRTMLGCVTEDYNEELEKLNMISASTGYSVEEIEKRFFEGNILEFMNMFESEVRNYYSVVTIIYTLDLSCACCGKADYMNYSDLDRLKTYCDYYARCELFRNGCIRILKEGNDVEEKINNLYESLLTNEYITYSADSKAENNFVKFCKQICNICEVELS